MNTATELKVGDIDLTDHAFKRFKERINGGCTEKSHALNILRSLLKRSVCLGENISEEGDPGILYAIDRHAIYLSSDLKRIVTVNRFETITHAKMKEKVKLIHERELNNLRRREKCLSRKHEREKLKLTVELAELELRHYKTRSKNVKKECKQRQDEIVKYIRNMDHELKIVQDAIRQISRSMVSVL